MNEKCDWRRGGGLRRQGAAGVWRWVARVVSKTLAPSRLCVALGLKRKIHAKTLGRQDEGECDWRRGGGLRRQGAAGVWPLVARVVSKTVAPSRLCVALRLKRKIHAKTLRRKDE